MNKALKNIPIDKLHQQFVNLLNKATNKTLKQWLEILEKEIRLSETAIREGYEERC